MAKVKAPDFSGGATSARNALFRFVFSRTDNVRGELRALLPLEIVTKLELESLQLLRAGADPASTGGLLFSVRLSSREAYVWLELDPGNAPQTAAPLRLLAAMLQLWQRCAQELPRQPLPLIIPILVRQGDRRWRGPMSLCDLFEVDLPSWVAVAPLIPDFTLVLDDLAGTGAASLAARDQLPVAAGLALLLLQRAGRAPDLLAELSAWLEPIAQLSSAPGGADQLAVLLDYLLWMADVSLGRLRGLLARCGPGAEEIMTTTAERLLARGRSEGEQHGRAVTLLTILDLRFGGLADDRRQRVLRASSAELERWTERLLGAASPAELLD